MDEDVQQDGNQRLPRRTVLQILSAAALAGGIPGVAAGHPIIRHFSREHASRAQPAAGSGREFLDQHQFETLQSIAERIVPGASRAGTSEFIDRLLAVDSHEDQREFLSALGAFDGRARQRAGRPWKELDETEQLALLTEASTMEPGTPPDRPWTPGQPILPPRTTPGPRRLTLRDHFDLLKGWVAGAYYSSEIGMKELGWTGNLFFRTFPGCEHPGGHA